MDQGATSFNYKNGKDKIMMDSKPVIAVVLSGCGVYDGAEIHEAVATFLAIDRQGGAYQCYAPNIKQHHVVDHLTGKETTETRNVLVEAARIARGNIKDLKEFDVNQVDAVVFPGGFGVAKNLCTFALDGPDCTINEEVAGVVGSMVAADKPIAALCIAPALISKLLEGAKVTIGQDAETAQAIEAMGGAHTSTMHGEVVVDQRFKLVTSPCYMLESTIGQIADGATNTVKALFELIQK